MKKGIINLGIVLGITSIALVFNACTKEEEEKDPFVEENTEQENNQQTGIAESAVQVAKEDATAQFIFADAFNQVDGAIKDQEESIQSGKKSIKTSYPYATITPFDLTTWPKTLTIDFGPTNLLCDDGVFRRGIITSVVTDWYTNTGAQVTVTFDNYYVNDYHVEGVKVVTNNGRNAENHITYTDDVQNAIITDPNGLVSTWSSTRENEWIAGESTWLNPYDDEYMVTGSAEGVTSGGTDYTITITEELNVLVGCQYIRSGVIDIEANIQWLPLITVDFGNGTCDGSATVSAYGVTYPFIMGYGGY